MELSSLEVGTGGEMTVKDGTVLTVEQQHKDCNHTEKLCGLEQYHSGT